MSPATDRNLFRQTVALVAEKARARLPEQVNGRIESAVKLVLAQDVTRLEDGTIAVGSSTDPRKTYHLVGHTCTCTDFTQGRAPSGWCKHRISAGIDKRVRELLPQVPEIVEPWSDNDMEGPLPELNPTPQPAPAPLPEAPASVNVRVTIGGREVQWTLRDSDETRLAVRLEALLARYPMPQTPAQPLSPQQYNALAMHRPITGVCAIHQVPMTLNTKDGRSWYSHKTDQGWCKGR